MKINIVVDVVGGLYLRFFSPVKFKVNFCATQQIRDIGRSFASSSRGRVNTWIKYVLQISDFLKLYQVTIFLKKKSWTETINMVNVPSRKQLGILFDEVRKNQSPMSNSIMSVGMKCPTNIVTSDPQKRLRPTRRVYCTYCTNSVLCRRRTFRIHYFFSSSYWNKTKNQYG